MGRYSSGAVYLAAISRALRLSHPEASQRLIAIPPPIEVARGNLQRRIRQLRRRCQFGLEERELLCKAVLIMPVVEVEALKMAVFLHLHGDEIIAVDRLAT